MSFAGKLDKTVLTFEEGNDLVEGPVVEVAVELGDLDDVVLVKGHGLLLEVQVDNLLNRSSQVGKVLHVLSVADNSRLASQDATEGLHVWVQGHGYLLDEASLGVTEEDELVALRHLTQEDGKTRSLEDLEADA